MRNCKDRYIYSYGKAIGLADLFATMGNTRVLQAA